MKNEIMKKSEILNTECDNQELIKDKHALEAVEKIDKVKFF